MLGFQRTFVAQCSPHDDITPYVPPNNVFRSKLNTACWIFSAINHTLFATLCHTANFRSFQLVQSNLRTACWIFIDSDAVVTEYHEFSLQLHRRCERHVGFSLPFNAARWFFKWFLCTPRKQMAACTVFIAFVLNNCKKTTKTTKKTTKDHATYEKHGQHRQVLSPKP